MIRRNRDVSRPNVNQTSSQSATGRTLNLKNKLAHAARVMASYFGVSQDKSDTVSGLTNFSRNIGSSFGASLVTTVLARRQQFHLVRLGESMTPTSPMLSSTLQAMARQAPAGSGPSGQVVGLALIYQWLIGQAAALSFLDVYMVLGSASAMMFFASFLLKSNDPRHTEVKSGH